jgi:hypothetical protein
MKLRPEERRGPLKYLVGETQFAVLLLQLTNSPRLGRSHAPDVTVINVGLLDSHPHGLDPITELRCDPLHRAVLGPQLCSQRPHHPDCSGLLLRRIPTCRRPPISPHRCHDTILDSQVRSLHQTQSDSVIMRLETGPPAMVCPPPQTSSPNVTIRPTSTTSLAVLHHSPRLFNANGSSQTHYGYRRSLVHTPWRPHTISRTRPQAMWAFVIDWIKSLR